MKTMPVPSLPRRLLLCGWIAASSVALTAFGAQMPASRIGSDISSSSMSMLKGSLHPLAQARFDAGSMPSDTRLTGMTIVFNRSAAQQADLDALIAAQQNPASPLYHQWLTPEEFGARFGMSQSDIDKVENWLQQQGFSIDSVARAHTFIRFSGTVGQVDQAFLTQMHYYNVLGAKHFAPSSALSLPSAFAGAVANIGNLNDFRPTAQYIPLSKTRPRAAFTSSISGSVFFAPGDIKVAYDVNPLIHSGYDGTGQSIAVAGQSEVDLTDVENFQNAAALSVNDPTPVIVPGSGTPAFFSGDEGESDLDLEWSGAMATGAKIYFIYTGNNANYSAFDSVQYAIDEKIGDIVTLSYGECEPDLTTSQVNAFEGVLAEASTQGQTLIAASGDEGSTSCFVENPAQTGDPALNIQQELAVSYPASSQYFTGVGGTEITAADSVSTNSTYWEGENTSDELTSLLKYIPEVAWNDDAFNIQNGCTGNCLSASGGGASSLFGKPSWQKGVTGIPADSHRDVPDISLYASPSYPGYLYCTSDTSDWGSGQQGSCNTTATGLSGFRDAATGDLTIAGGTSFAAPIFAGMLAVLNQAKGYTTGQGNINPALYTLAGGADYATAFHDVTTGNNYCLAGSNNCSGTSTSHYNTNAGYDQVTGLGSIDLNTLASDWGSSTSSLIGTTTVASASNSAPAVNASDTFTITVAAVSGSATPTGAITLQIDGGTALGGTTVSETLSAQGTYTYTTSFATAGPHEIVVQYAGNATFASSTGAIVVTVPTTNSGTGTITLGATPSTLPISQGSQGTETVSVTPAGGYTGTVELTYSYPNSDDTALQNLCVFAGTGLSSSGTLSVSGTTAVTGQIIFDTNASDCVSSAMQKGGTTLHRLRLVKTAKNSPPSGPGKAPLGIAFAGLLLAGFLGRYSRKLRGLACLIVLAAAGLAISACGGGSSSSGGGGTAPSDPSKGTYSITLAGTDSTTATITSQTTFTLTIN